MTIAGHCESALAVGGDYYDVIVRPDGGVLFVVVQMFRMRTR